MQKKQPAKKAPKKQLSANSISELIAQLPADKRPLVDPSGPLYKAGPNWLMIVLPAPHAALHSQNNGSCYAKSVMVKALKNKSHSIALKHRVPKWEGAFIEYRFFFADDRKRDSANAIHSMKAAIDGIVKSGLIPDDDYSHLWIKSICCAVDRKNPRTELIFHQSCPEAIRSLQDAQLELRP